MLALAKTNIATSRSDRLSQHYGAARCFASRAVQHQRLLPPLPAKQSRASPSLAIKAQQSVRQVKAPNLERAEQVKRQSKVMEVMRHGADPTEICTTEYQVVFRSQLELVVLDHRRSQLELEANNMAGDEKYHFSTTGTSHWTVLQSTRKTKADVEYEILNKKLLLRNQQTQPRFVSVNDPALQHQAERLLAQHKKAGRRADASIQYPKVQMTVREAQMYLDILDYVRLTQEVRTLRVQAAIMRTLPEFRFSTNNKTAQYHLMVHNLYSLQGALAELQAMQDKYGLTNQRSMPNPGAIVDAVNQFQHVQH